MNLYAYLQESLLGYNELWRGASCLGMVELWNFETKGGVRINLWNGIDWF